MTFLPSCRETRERLTDYAEGALSVRERALLRMHLLICSACMAFFRGLLTVPGVARFLLTPDGSPSSEGAEALSAALGRIPRHREKD
jgi:anti-sigma factor ChrR (cupin superfamily)